MWELAYQEVPAISKGYGEISKSVVWNTDTKPFHKELRNRNISENNFFLYKRKGQSLWNPYINTSRQLVGPEISAKILEFFDKSLTEYLMFPEERYLQKNIREIIKLFNMPPFVPKTNLKRMNDTSRVSVKRSDQENWWSTEENWYSTREILRYDHDECWMSMFC